MLWLLEPSFFHLASVELIISLTATEDFWSIDEILWNCDLFATSTQPPTQLDHYFFTELGAVYPDKQTYLHPPHPQAYSKLLLQGKSCWSLVKGQ